MPIYPDRKNGQLTGRYRVEVTVDGQRRRGRANSLADAKSLEAGGWQGEGGGPTLDR